MANAKSFPIAIKAPVPSTHHDGELAADIFAPSGTPWLAVFDGTAVPGDYPDGGYTIILTASDGTEAYYAHGLPNRISGNVRAGETIGYVDNSGNAANTASHLHFAVGTINSIGGGTISPAVWLSGDMVPQTQKSTDESVLTWQRLAIQEADRQQAPHPIVLATIEGESTVNKTGDSGNALGFGQVWPLWHMDAFNLAAQLLDLPQPPQYPDLAGLTAYTLGDDQYSMAVAVRVIKQVWESVGGDISKFLYAYIGPGLSAADFARRKALYDKYVNSNFDPSGQTPGNTGGGGIPGNTGGGGPTAFFGARTQITIPKTNFQVVPGSGAFGDILYGRRYRVMVSDLSGEIAFDVSQLRCTFNCVATMQVQPNYSSVIIYNLSPQTENLIIKEGYLVTIEAGYASSQYGIIFTGNVTQPIRSKENGTTYTLELISMDSGVFYAYGTANFTLLRGQNSRAIVDAIVARASVPTEPGRISPDLSSAQLTRGKAVFGMAQDILRQVAQSENATYYHDNGKVNIVKATDLPEGEIISLSPATGLIGVPTQQQFGANIKMLLNPRVQVGTLIQIDNSLIKTQRADVGQGQPVYMLDQDGIYRVIRVNHIGDTRGNDWYTQVDTVSQSGTLPNMISSGSQTPW